MNKKAQVSMYLSFLLLAFVVIAITAFVAPLGAKFTVAAYGAGEKILNSSLDDINAIQNEDVRLHLNNTFNSARATTEDNVDVTTSMFKYSWLIVLALGALVMFLYTRRVIEVNQGGFV